MPVVRVTLLEDRTPEQKAAAARDITEALAKHCKASADHIYVIFEDVAADDWMIGGESVTQRRQKHPKS